MEALCKVTTYWQGRLTQTASRLQYLADQWSRLGREEWRKEVEVLSQESTTETSVQNLVDQWLQDDPGRLTQAIRRREAAVIECLVSSLEQLIHKSQDVLSESTMARLVNGLYVLNTGVREEVQEVVARLHFRFIGLLSHLVGRMHRQ